MLNFALLFGQLSWLVGCKSESDNPTILRRMSYVQITFFVIFILPHSCLFQSKKSIEWSNAFVMVVVMHY
jgi:hypothetical protein